MNILMLLTDGSDYKTCLELKNYLNSKNIYNKHIVNYKFIDADIEMLKNEKNLY